MFDKCINNLLELYSNGGNIVVNKSIENFARSQADKEGGNFEINQKLNKIEIENKIKPKIIIIDKQSS